MLLEITDLNHQGEGVGRLAGKVYFVAGALPGEQVEIEVVAEKKSWARAVTDAIAAAQANAVLNGVNNVSFSAGLAEQVLPVW